MEFCRWSVATALMIAAVNAFAQSDSAEDFRVELTGGAWNTSIEGTVRALALPIALRSDLALQDEWAFFGKLTVKPAHRHRINIEGVPYSFQGLNALARNITF